MYLLFCISDLQWTHFIRTTLAHGNFYSLEFTIKKDCLHKQLPSFRADRSDSVRQRWIPPMADLITS